MKLESLSSNVLQRGTSTGSEFFPLLVCFDALKETICPRICSKSRTKSASSPLTVGSKTIERQRNEYIKTAVHTFSSSSRSTVGQSVVLISSTGHIAAEGAEAMRRSRVRIPPGAGHFFIFFLFMALTSVRLRGQFSQFSSASCESWTTIFPLP